MKEHANGFPSIKISETGKKVAHQDFFGYLQILDAENQFCPNLLSMKTSKIRTLAQHAISSLKMTTTHREI
jgi:hypothetical protein